MTCSCWFPRSPRKLLLSRLLDGQPLGSSTKQVCVRQPEEPGRHLRRPYAVWLFVLATIQAPLNPVFASLHLKPRPWQFQVGAESWRVAGLIVDDTFYLVWLDEKHAHCTCPLHAAAAPRRIMAQWFPSCIGHLLCSDALARRYEPENAPSRP
jgi:hypothetical protein